MLGFTCGQYINCLEVFFVSWIAYFYNPWINISYLCVPIWKTWVDVAMCCKIHLFLPQHYLLKNTAFDSLAPGSSEGSQPKHQGHCPGGSPHLKMGWEENGTEVALVSIGTIYRTSAPKWRVCSLLWLESSLLPLLLISVSLTHP